MSRSAAQSGEEAGFTMVELLVAMTIGLAVLGAVASVVVSAVRTQRVTGDVAAMGDQARVAVEWIRRDIRQAERVEAGSTETVLTLWIDRNADRMHAHDELITYQVVDDAEGARLERSVGALPPRVVARGLTAAPVFTYGPSPPETRAVAVHLAVGPEQRHAAEGRKVLTVTDLVRLRNVR